MSAPTAPETERPSRPATPKRRVGDLVFGGLPAASAFSILLILAGVAIFLISEALPVFGADPADVTGGNGFLSYVWPLIFGTLVASRHRDARRDPLAVGIALFVSHYAQKSGGHRGRVRHRPARRRAQRRLRHVGLDRCSPRRWCRFFLWLEEHLGFLPFFESASRDGTHPASPPRSCWR